ncbi:MAG: hypothetical protein EBU90_07680 [Proteobacteria bacterium]|nr:hypothetical protein [Pseudomonadota bacterium]NBP13418.1 hypothetical protein [bacterium]
MSVESKIKELLERVSAKANLDEAEQMGAGSVSKDSSIKAQNSGDSSSPKQGNSEDASYEERDENQPNQGAVAAKSVSKSPVPQGSGAGATPNFNTVGDPRSAVNQSSSAGNKMVAEEEEEESELENLEPTSVEVQKIDLSPIFGEGLSEEFKEKATAIFEAAVIARVNAEMEQVTVALQEQFDNQLAESIDQMVDKVDSYLNYVVENWMEENELALENGLRTEIAEDFITGLKTLFKESYIEVPEEKYDILGELQAKVDSLETKLDESMQSNIDLNKEISNLKRASVFEEVSKGLADTEIAKFDKLLEGVDFENETLYKEKLLVIRENYFPKGSSIDTPSVVEQKTLTEGSSEPIQQLDESSTVSVYAKALSRTIKRN